jgi:hypothetical protein
MAIEDVLARNLAQYRRWGDKAYDADDLNTAVTLYYKALVAISDMIIYRKTGLVPSNHTERFRLMRREYPELYEVLDRDFAHYRDSYHLEIRREVVEVVRADVERFVGIVHIS